MQFACKKPHTIFVQSTRAVFTNWRYLLHSVFIPFPHFTPISMERDSSKRINITPSL